MLNNNNNNSKICNLLIYNVIYIVYIVRMDKTQTKTSHTCLGLSYSQ